MSFTVLLDGVDVSARCLTAIRVSRAENSAAVANFTYSPSTTPLLPTNLIRKPVVISDSGHILFTGKVNGATWDLKNRRYDIVCSDLLQEAFEVLTDAQILAAIPGSTYSIALFGEREDGWRYAQDAMSTVTADTHLQTDGVTIESVSWAAKVTPDFTYTAGSILNDGAYRLELAEARDIITQRKIQYQHRVSRWKVRDHSFTWPGLVGMNAWCIWAQSEGWYLPTKEVVESAAAGTGWEVRGRIATKGHPESGAYCNNAIIWINEIQSEDVVSASWNATRHWGQTITETYEVTLNCSASQVSFGMVTTEDEFANAIEADDAGFETGPSEVGDGWPTDPLGDRFEDQFDDTTRINDLTTIINRGVNVIWDSHRKNYVTIDVPIEHLLSLAHTVEIATPDINARGKVSRLEHLIDAVRSLTRLTIAISRGGGGSSDPIVIPGRPDTAPGHAPPNTGTTLSTYVGGCSDSPDYDETWMGWSTIVPQTVTIVRDNPAYIPEGEPGHDPTIPEYTETTFTRPACTTPANVPTPEQLYPRRFQVKGPDIESESRDEVEATSTSTFEVAVPDDVLVLF